MGTTLATLSPPAGARHKRKRKGRGPGSGNGMTAGKGTKGQRSRSGVAILASFEGGQMPLQRRLPKRGFKNPFRVEYHGINVSQLAKVFEAGETVSTEELKAKGLMPRKAERVKILGQGEIPFALTLKVHGISKSAREKVEKAGGTVEVVVPRERGPKAKAKP